MPAEELKAERNLLSLTRFAGSKRSIYTKFKKAVLKRQPFLFYGLPKLITFTFGNWIENRKTFFQQVNVSDRQKKIDLLLSSYDLFIFDLDGTLYNQQKLRNIVLVELIFRLLTFRINLKDLKIINKFRKLREQNLAYESPGIHDEQFQWCANALNIPFDKVKNVIEHWMIQYPLRYLRKARYPKVKSFFLELKNHNKHIAIYSDFPVDKKLKALKLTADKTYCSTEAHIAQLKPSKKGTDIICKEFNCHPEQAVFFGDRMDTDGESARLAGVHFILVDVRKARKGKFYLNLLNQILDQDGKE